MKKIKGPSASPYSRTKWRLKQVYRYLLCLRLVTPLNNRRYINNFIYLSIYLSYLFGMIHYAHLCVFLYFITLHQNYLPMPAWSGTTVSFWQHPAHCWFQPPPSPFVVIYAASDPTYTAVYCQQSHFSGGRMLPLEQSATRCHLRLNSDSFSEQP